MTKPDLSAMHRTELEATIVSQTKVMERFRNKLGSIILGIEDEGDRVYFGSTNDADELRDIESDMLDHLNLLECPWMQGFDLYETIRALRVRRTELEAQIAELRAAPERSGWLPIEDYPTDTNGRPVEAVREDGFMLVSAPELLDEDFNPTGIGQAHYQDGGTIDEHVEAGAWVAPKWCNCHDEFHLRVVRPTHYRFVAATTGEAK